MSNKLYKAVLIFSFAGLISSCDFADKNIDPDSSNTIEPGPLLTYSQLNTTTGGHCKNIQVGTCMMIVQQTASLQREDMPGDKYYTSEAFGTLFNDDYSSLIKNWREMMIQAEKDPKYENMVAVGKIWGAFLFQRLTDLYGNIPYSEAGMGYYKQNYYPQYDTQESIYTALISDVKEGLSMISPDKPAIEGDIIYNGDINKWKKFGNSLLLRLGMRICKVNPDKAKSIVAEAVQGGVMDSADDICMVKHIEGESRTENPLTNRFITDKFVELGTVKVSKTFIDYLKQTNDPRLSVLCSLPDGDNSPANQRGLPNGYDQNTISTGDPAFIDQKMYSNFNTNTILTRSAATIFLVPSESQLLLAEAALKGWISGDANTYYEAAIISAMKEPELAYGDAAAINSNAVIAYLNQNIFTNATTLDSKMEVLGNAYWVSTFINGYESFANWRRTGYPKLTPTNYPGGQNAGRIPRRLTYPTKEYTINKANVEAAVQQQGADNVNTRVWWDKE